MGTVSSRATIMMRTSHVVVILAATTILGGVGNASAQVLTSSDTTPASSVTPAATTGNATTASPSTIATVEPALLQPLIGSFGDLRRLRSWNTVTWLTIGLGATAALKPVDTSVSRDLSGKRSGALKPGAFIGGAPFEIGSAFATYAIGRAIHKPRVVSLGNDLVRAQVISALVTAGVKRSVQRTRPDGTSYSFPSGHTAASFASATVFQQHFGWKAGVPAYAVATYVAASRVQAKRHYLSDVAFGATLGVIAGRTVSVGHGNKLQIEPLATESGGGISLSWVGKH